MVFWSKRYFGRRKLIVLACVLLSLSIWTFVSPLRFLKQRLLLDKYQTLVHGINIPNQQKAIAAQHIFYSKYHLSSVYHEQTNEGSTKPQFKQDKSDHLLNTSSAKDSEKEKHFAYEETSLSFVYKNKWVGFHEIDGQNCPQAVYSRTYNKLFVESVQRTFNEQLVSDSKNCESFRINYGYNRYPIVTEEESNFPIAFIILFHSNLDQVLFLLRAIYRAHNVYCLSVDANTGGQFISDVKTVVQCLPNVFVASKLEKIVYAGFTRLMADIDCMEDLLRRPEPWKYVINMPGQQFPLRTNLELVKILTMFNGSSDVEMGEEKMTCVKNRHIMKHVYVINNITGKLGPVKTDERNPPPPHGLQIVKGSTYGTFSRAFVHFVVHHPIAKEFLEWNKNVLSPDEYFWSTLQHTKVLPVPGGATENHKQPPYVTSFSVWKGSNKTCATKFVRKICIFSPEDLSYIVKQTSLFANKFYINYHPAALHCLDQWLVNRTFAGSVIDLAVYNRTH